MEMTSKEFAFNYAGDKFILDDDIVILVGYNSEDTKRVIVSPAGEYGGIPWYWEFLDSMDIITYTTNIGKYQYADLNELVPVHKTIGELIKEHEGVSGIQFSTGEHGNVQAAYIRGKHGAMKLVSAGDSLENVLSKI